MQFSACPKCNNVMEEGFVVDNADGGARLQSHWVEGQPEQSWLTGVKTRGRRKLAVTTTRCTS